jgi:hypothetical protein
MMDALLTQWLTLRINCEIAREGGGGGAGSVRIRRQDKSQSDSERTNCLKQEERSSSDCSGNGGCCRSSGEMNLGDVAAAAVHVFPLMLLLLAPDSINSQKLRGGMQVCSWVAA